MRSVHHVPNLLSVHDFEPDRLILVESSEMKRRHVTDTFLKALQHRGLDRTGSCHAADRLLLNRR